MGLRKQNGLPVEVIKVLEVIIDHNIGLNDCF